MRWGNTTIIGTDPFGNTYTTINKVEPMLLIQSFHPAMCIKKQYSFYNAFEQQNYYM